MSAICIHYCDIYIIKTNCWFIFHSKFTWTCFICFKSFSENIYFIFRIQFNKKSSIRFILHANTLLYRCKTLSTLHLIHYTKENETDKTNWTVLFKQSNFLREFLRLRRLTLLNSVFAVKVWNDFCNFNKIFAYRQAFSKELNKHFFLKNWE